MLLRCGIIFNLIHVDFCITSLLLLNSHPSILADKAKNSVSQFFSSVICIHLGISVFTKLCFFILYFVQGMTLNCIHMFIVTGSFLYWCVMRPASQRLFIRSCIYLRIVIISCSATFLGTNSLYMLMCRKAVNQSINHLVLIYFHSSRTCE